MELQEMSAERDQKKGVKQMESIEEKWVQEDLLRTQNKMSDEWNQLKKASMQKPIKQGGLDIGMQDEDEKLQREAMEQAENVRVKGE